MLELELVYKGEAADEGFIEFYDVSRALAGFQRSIDLTTHFVLSGDVITQAPAAKGFQIFLPPFEKPRSQRTKKIRPEKFSSSRS